MPTTGKFTHNTKGSSRIISHSSIVLQVVVLPTAFMKSVHVQVQYKQFLDVSFLSNVSLLTKTIPNVLEFHDPNLSDFSKSFAKSSRGCSFLKNVSLGSKDNHQPSGV